MHRFLLSGSAVAALLTPAMAQENTQLQDVIIVSGSRLDPVAEMTVTPVDCPPGGADVTQLAARVPGGARIGNGELSGQMQYRGLFGERLNLRVDGQRFASGGPNLMDPVFHYAPMPLIAALVVDRGVSPVSEGPGLAGGADAVFKKIGYAEGSAPQFGYDLSFAGRTVNDSYEAGGVIGASNDQWRFNALGSYEKGNDTEYADGTIGGTSFERAVYGLSAGRKIGDGELSLDLRRQNTGESGNPSFPMDIRFFDTDFARLTYEQPIGAITLRAGAHYTDVSHGMNNFDMRPALPLARKRETFAYATTKGAHLDLETSWIGGMLQIGTDIEVSDHDVIITNPENPDFFVTAFPKIETERLGIYAEWTGPVGPVEGEFGLRIDQYDQTSADARLGPALPMGPRGLANTFNAADRDQDDTTVDAVARLWTDASQPMSWRLTLARKSAIPGYIQRYGWLPINASGGLSDGNIYVGDIALAPEKATIAEVGFDYRAPKVYASPTLFVRQIDDYIQGTPFDDTPSIADTPQEMVAAGGGDPTPLRWRNVDARLYGFDVEAGYDFDGPLRIDAVASYVRGERRDIDDYLYRVAAPSLTTGLTYERQNWAGTIEARMVADQSDVSTTNSESPSDGYTLINSFASVDISDGVHLSFGVENLTDEVYQDHLSGVNRNGLSDVTIGERVFGSGRSAFLRLSLSY